VIFDFLMNTFDVANSWCYICPIMEALVLWPPRIISFNGFFNVYSFLMSVVCVCSH